MMRIQSLALGAVMVFGLAVVAPAEAQRPGKGKGKRAQTAEASDRRALMGGLLRGIDLTQAQQEQVGVIRERYEPRFKAVRDSLRPELKEVRDARQSGDSTALRDAMQDVRDERGQILALTIQQAADIRAVLTPEQQTKFDQNREVVVQRVKDQMADTSAGPRGIQKRKRRP
jgi:Spy/CpxP family protein refolding chaperone